MKVSIAGKGGVGKTTVSVLFARALAARGRRTLVVDCDPNPMVAEELGLDSAALERFGRDGLRPAPGTLELAREPPVVEVAERLWMLAGPPGDSALADAVARGIAGVLVAERFDVVVTDLGAGPEIARVAVGGVLNPADVCFVLTDGTPSSDAAADRIEAACTAREVRSIRVVNRRGDPAATARELEMQVFW